MLKSFEWKSLQKVLILYGGFEFFRVDQLYAFFVQWKPELYGDEEEISAERRGFVVLEDDDKEDSEEMEVFEEYFNNGVTALQKDWEVQNGSINAVKF